MGVNAGHKSPSPSPECMPDIEEYEKFQDRWTKEMSRPKPKTDHQVCVTGYGSWYKRKPYTYSNDEFKAPQVHNDRVCTVDCTPLNRDEHKLGNDNSFFESDWGKRTSVVPKVYWKCKKAERHIHDSKRASSKGSGHNSSKRGK